MSEGAFDIGRSQISSFFSHIFFNVKDVDIYTCTLIGYLKKTILILNKR